MVQINLFFNQQIVIFLYPLFKKHFYEHVPDSKKKENILDMPQALTLIVARKVITNMNLFI